MTFMDNTVAGMPRVDASGRPIKSISGVSRGRLVASAET